MKVLKITKTINGAGFKRTFYRIILNDDETLESLSGFVEDICENDMDGFYRGYSYDYDFETDPKVIDDVIKREINKVMTEIHNKYDYLEKLLEIK